MSALVPRSLLVGSLALLMGCGGEEEPPVFQGRPQPAQKSTAPAVAPVVVEASKGKSPATTRPQQANNRQGNTPAASELPPGVEPEDLFRVDATDHSWTVAATPVERSTFEVVARPPSGSTEPIFVRAAPGIDPATGRRVSNAYQPRNVTSQAQAAGGLPEGFQAVPNSETSEEGLPLRITCDADGSEMVLIPAGAFPRGTNNGPSNAAPEHTVYLDSYYISKHEVTLEQFAKFREAHDKLDRRRLATPSNAGAHVRMPVLGVPHRDATDFAIWAKCALPTEAQWEKAARGINGYPYPWGYERPVWPAARPLNDVAQVMTYRTDVSPYGVFDLAGNAREWVADVYAEGYPEAGPNGEKLLRNPTGPRRTSSSPGVIRGNGPDWKVWHRVSNLFGQPPADVGFRCVLNLPAPGAEPAADENSRQPAPGRGF